MKATTQVFGAALLATLGFAACKNTEFKKTKDGMPYKIFATGSGAKIVPGNIISAHITNKLGDSVLRTTYGGGPQPIPVPPGGPQLDQLRFILDARKGDSILLLQSIDSMLAKMPAGMPADPFLSKNKGKNVETYIRIVDVFKDQESMVAGQKSKDEAALAAYFKTNNVQTKRSTKGVYVQTLAPGNGTTPKLGQVVSVRYSGKFLNGKEFDSNKQPGAPTLDVPLGSGMIIPGLEDGLMQLSKGEKAIIYIPSYLGYGAQGFPPRIGPNENLMFDIEVLNIADQKAQGPMMPPQAMPDSAKK